MYQRMFPKVTQHYTIVVSLISTNWIIVFRSFSFRYSTVSHVERIRGACLQPIRIVCKARKNIWPQTFYTRTSKCLLSFLTLAAPMLIIFRLSCYSLTQTENMTADECAKLREMELNLENERKSSYGGKKKKVKPEAMAATTWRDLIPVIKIDISTVRMFNK